MPVENLQGKMKKVGVRRLMRRSKLSQEAVYAIMEGHGQQTILRKSPLLGTIPPLRAFITIERMCAKLAPTVVIPGQESPWKLFGRM